MSDPESTPSPASLPVPHRRRPRYAGKNPRRFEDKYKEHDPARYAADVAKVIASGKTPAGSHRPIMVAEILAVLALQPGEVAVVRARGDELGERRLERHRVGEVGRALERDERIDERAARGDRRGAGGAR